MPEISGLEDTSDSGSSEPVIGIDLGTTNSCVACWEGNVDMVIVNKDGHRTTPSCVAFNDVEHLVGHAAKREMTRNPQNVVFSVKRLIGRKFDDPQIQQDKSDWPFRVEADEQGRPQIKLKYKNEEVMFSPEKISAMVLENLKDAAQTRLGVAVKKAVITVPAYFDNSQKQATIDAGRIAGLEVLRIINEPTAAALAYGMGKKASDCEQKVLVFDLGGGTFDVSILSIVQQEFNVKAVGGDAHLGGDDFDKCLMDHCRSDLKKKHGLTLDAPLTINRLRDACRQAKEHLSTSLQASIDLPWLAGEVSYSTTVTRSLFESLCEALFTACLTHVKETLASIGMLQSELDVVLVVGGSSRIPKLQEMLREFFEGHAIFRSGNPDEDVAKGAALQGALLRGVEDKKLKSVQVNDITPLSLGVRTCGDSLSVIIERNSPIPTKKSRSYVTVADNQTTITSVIYEGDKAKASSNHELGVLTIDGLNPASRGATSILTTFSLDANGILDVTVSDEEKLNEKRLSIKLNKGRLSRQELEKEIRDVEQMKEEDEKWRQAVCSKNRLYFLIQDGKKSTDAQVLAKCEEFENWLEANPSAPKEKYEQMSRELELQQSGFLGRFLGMFLNLQTEGQ